MKFFKTLLFLVFGLSTIGFGIEPTDDIPVDTIALDEVKISGQRLNHFATGLKVNSVQKELIHEFKTQSLAELLAEHSQIFIKSYGNAGLATASTRGSGTNHTAILWNGFNLQDPMNGTTNLANIPVSFIDEIEIQQGGSGALFGSGALGGAIHFNSNLSYNKGLEIKTNQKYGSYQNIFNAVNLNYSNNHFSTSTRFFQQTAQNDYEYKNIAAINQKTEKLSNAEYQKYGFLQSLKYKINHKQEISIHGWYQNSFNELPSTMLNANPGKEEQKDDYLRLTAEWNRFGEISTTNIRTAYLDKKNIYTNPSLNITTNNHSTSYITEIEQKFQLGSNQLLNLGINETYETASSEYYGNTKYRNRLSVFSSYKIFNIRNTFSSTISLRNEIINQSFSPLTYSLGIKADLFQWLFLTGNFSKNYRVPTFNELYWGNWGNPDLEPEEGFSEDLGLTFYKTFSAHKTKFNITIFNSNVDNWIIWVPDHTIWTPKNVQKVWSRGLETSLNYNLNLGNFDIYADASYNYNKATNETNNQLTNKQLIYVPEHQYNWGIKLMYKIFDLRYNESFTGKRYTSENNLQYVNDYTVGNMHMGLKLNSNMIKGKITFSIYNIWNCSYQVMAWYPMPLRNYAISLSLNFNNK